MELKKQHFLKSIENSKGIILSLCRVYFLDSEDQKDAFQDVILQLWKSFDSFRGDSELNTWVYTISLRTILNKIRKSKKSVAHDRLDGNLAVAIPLADDNKELLNIIIQQLNEDDKALVVLFLEGYKNKEIAEILEITPTNVSTRLNRIKSQLKLKYNRTSDAVRRS